ncbi:MAG: hypothetical protein GY859_39835 [Desulfobacterales bacterium]|nr:hypothetical protein [Desulfobacterales bacterium]
MKQMKIRRLVIRDCDIPFKFRFSQSTNIRDSSEGLLTEATTENGTTGYGECLPREYVSGETTAGVVAAIESVAHRVVGREFNHVDEIAAWSDALAARLSAGGRAASCARCALELAVLDAFGRERSLPRAGLPGAPRVSRIRYSGIVGDGGPRELEWVAAFFNAMEFKQIKLKVGRDPRADLDAVGRLKSCFGPGIDLRVDANGAWSLEEALERIPALASAGVRAVEQPLPRADRDCYPRLMAALASIPVSVWVDESVCTLEDARWFAAHGAAAGINLKVSKNGGLFNCMAIAAAAREHGLACQLGAQVGETSLITAAGRILAALEGDFVYHEGSFGKYLLAHDIVDQPLDFGRGGDASLHEALCQPGLGVRVNPRLVGRLRVLRTFTA